MTYPDPTNRAAWLAHFRQGFAGRPGVNPGQPFQPGAITGGVDGPTVEVRTPAELDAAMATPGPVWIIAYPSAGGRRPERLVIDRDNVTLIAPHWLTFHRRGLLISRAMNVCVYGVVAFKSAAHDAIEISESRVWSLVNCRAEEFTGDGGIDIVRGSTDGHLEDCRATSGKKGCLIGADARPFVADHRGDLALRHLGIMDDRQIRVSMRGCVFSSIAARSPLVRHGAVVLEDHWVQWGGKNQVEARDGARVAWLSGGVYGMGGKAVATDRGRDRATDGRLYVAPGVRLNGATATANWQPTAGDMLAMGVGAG